MTSPAAYLKEMLFESPHFNKDWLEATLELLDARRRATHNEDNDVNLISTAYNDLLNRMAEIRTKERPVKEDIEIIKNKFLGLLDLCGIKDADIPLFDDPMRVRTTRQTLITSFGIMSKSLNAAVTPRNRGRSTRNTDNYADMLIEHILADVSPDSETSPPSAEERTSGLSSMGSRLSPASKPSRQRQRNSTTMYHTCPGQLSQHAHLSLSHLVHQRLPTNNNSVITASNIAHTPQRPTRQLTPDSGDPESEVSHAPCSPTPEVHDEGTMDRTLQNATSGSTPELPVSESSESLDIPFASLFDNEEFFSRIQDFPDMDEMSASACPSNTASPVAAQTSTYRFPARYSQSYARELQRVEANEIVNFNTCASQEGIPRPSFQGDQDNVKAYNMRSESSNGHIPYDELLIVHLPDKESTKNLNCSDKNELIKDLRVDININNNYKPHLEDKSGLVVPGPESPKPPIPPRRPLTDSKVGRFVLQSNNSGLGTLWCRQKCDSPSQELARHKRLPELFEPKQSECMTTGKAYMREKQRQMNDILSTVKDQCCSPQSARYSESLNASKRRKGNDKNALPMDHDIRPMRPVRQRLFASPNASPSKVQSLVRSTLSTPSQVTPSHQHGRRSEKTRRKRHSPAMRRLIEQKENNILSPSLSQNGPRKPLNEIYNICLNESDPLTTSSNSLTTSSDAYARSSETSPDLPLPSREEELRDRDAHYCDFTLDRQHKIDTLSPKQRQHLYRKDTKENFYMFEDPTTNEIIVRKVEGAESSPQKNVFVAPKPNTHAPRSIQTQIRSGSTSRRSSATSSSDSRRSSSSSSSKSENRRRSSRSSSRSTTNSHPMASSTIIEYSSQDTDDGASTVPSIYTWTIEEAEPCNLEKSYIRSRQARRALRIKSKPQTPRPPTSIGRDSPVNAKNNGPFEITAMVTEIDKHLNESAAGIQKSVNDSDDVMTGASNFRTNCPIGGRRNVLTCSPSFIEKSMSKTSEYNYNDSDDSCLLSQQASTSSMVFNRARASIQCSSNEPSDIPDLRHLSSAPSSSRTLSSSAPELMAHSIVNDATPELLSELSILEDREDIPGKSSSSGSSSCTAARCRPHITRSKALNADTRLITGNSQDHPVGNQDLIDSILTDSPKSVDSSGIFAPYNSYNSPAESVGSHNGYSSTVSSSIPSSENCYQLAKSGPSVPPPTPSKTQSEEAFATGNAPKNQSKGVKFKRPFNPAPHTLHIPNTRSRGVSAMAQFITPRRPMSVRSDPLANKSMFAVPPGVVTGPPKISDKKSLVKKLKKFSTNFYRKNEKIRTLANL